MKKYIDILPEKIVFQGNLDPIKLLVGGNEMIKTTLNIKKHISKGSKEYGTMAIMLKEKVLMVM